ncbi:MAG: hypothetical protein ACE5Q6_16445 [Dehalococcoidia bacterium]
MVSVDVLEKIEEQDVTSQQLNSTVSHQVENILEDAGDREDTDQPKTMKWHYSVPFAGVRYYSY